MIHRYKDMIMKSLACGYCTGRYPSIWCPVFEKEAEQRSYFTLFSPVDDCETEREGMKNDEDGEMDSRSSLDNVDKVLPHFRFKTSKCILFAQRWGLLDRVLGLGLDYAARI
jgi:hypothetical protein